MKVSELIGEEWAELIGDEFEKDYMKELSAFITEDRNKETVYPLNSFDTFQVFRSLPPREIKVLVIGQDPYTDGSYDGRAFSNKSTTISISKSLRNILKEVNEDVYDGIDKYSNYNPNLERWEKQGVFLINRILTVRKGQPLSHKSIGWEIFTSNVINKLSSVKKHLVFMLWGAFAQEITKDIEKKESHLILTAAHPSPLSAHRGFFGCRHFSKANDFLLTNKLDFIEW